MAEWLIEGALPSQLLGSATPALDLCFPVCYAIAYSGSVPEEAWDGAVLRRMEEGR